MIFFSLLSREDLDLCKSNFIMELIFLISRMKNHLQDIKYLGNCSSSVQYNVQYKVNQI